MSLFIILLLSIAAILVQFISYLGSPLWLNFSLAITFGYCIGRVGKYFNKKDGE